LMDERLRVCFVGGLLPSLLSSLTLLLESPDLPYDLRGYLLAVMVVL
jgi:hypothetical protein